MRASSVTGLVSGSVRSLGQRPVASIQASWTQRKAFGQLDQKRNSATLAEAPSPLHDLSQPEAIPESARRAEAKKIFTDAVAATAPRNSWTRQEISAIYYQPPLELAYQAVRFLALKPGNEPQLTGARPPSTDDSTAPGRFSFALS